MRAELFAAVGALSGVCGFMAFDAYAHDDARRMFTFGLTCAEEADDWHLRAKLLSNLARQAIWCGDPDAGLTHTELALVRADRLTATELAMLHTARARALGKLGRTQETFAAVGQADEAFARSCPGNDPPWMAYYDQAQHHGDTAHALFDLAIHDVSDTEAAERLSVAVKGHADAYARSRAISGTKLASLLMATDDLRELRRFAGRHARLPEVARLRERITQLAGLSATGAEPIRLGENAIFRLPDGIVARIARVGQQSVARREIAVSRWLNAAGVSAVAAWGDLDQPVDVNGRSVTFWDELPPHSPGSLPQVAAVLRRLHVLPIPEAVPLSSLDPFVRLSERIGQAATLTGEDRAWLADRLAALERDWASLWCTMPTCVVHGDAWTGNVAATDDGRVILLDLERCSLGPPEWDLVSTAVKYVTFGQVTQTDYQQFCDAYGQDVTDWAGFHVLRDIRELRVTCYAAQQAAEQPQLADEAGLRVSCLQGRHGPRPWPWTPV